MPTDILFIGCNGHVAAIDIATGSEIWRTKLKTGVVSATSYEDVCTLEHEGRVYAGCNGHLFCLDGATGTILWHNGLEGMGHNDVTLAMAGKLIQFVAKHTHSQSA
jgi:outer membrane protein assembly factor BamB